MAHFETYEVEEEEGALFSPPALFRATVLPARFGVEAAFQSECMTNVRALIRGREAV